MMKAAVLNKGSPGKRILWLAFFVLILLASSPAFAADYYVSTTGNDSNPGTEAAPFKTIAKGSRALAAGDTLLIRAGTYAEAMYHGLGGFTFRSGTAGAYTRYAAYPGDEGKVIVKPPGGNIVVFMGGHSYVEIKGLVLDAVNTTGGAVIITRAQDLHNRIVNNEIRNGRQGIGGGGNHEIIGNNIHHMRGYGIYTGEDNGLVEGNIFHDNGGYAIHLYQSNHAVNNWVIRNNVFYNNGRGYYFEDAANGVPQLRKVQAVLISRGTNNQFYNNLVYNNNSGLFVGYGASNTLVANNTIYGNDLIGIDVSSANSGTRNARVINNIVWGNKKGQITNTGTNTTLQNNLTTDPKVVNAAGGDFHLTSASTDAIDKGQTLSNVPNDFDYGKRPFGAAYDIGAFEFGAPPGQSPSPPIAPGSGGTTTPPGTNPCPPAAGDGTTTPPPPGPPTPASPGTGNTYYISPNGNNGGGGSSAAPWKTFAFAIPKLNPGDTLVLKDGTYMRGSTGLLSVNCSGGAKNATLANPITVRAENERQAFIKADGRGNAVEVRNCRGWVIQGLHAENSDSAGYTGDAQPIAILSSNDIVVRRNLAAKPNRYGNNQGILVFAPRPTTSTNVLIEENELYDFHRNGIECFPETVSGCIIRRNYVSNRSYGPLPGVKNFGPNDGIIMYFARNSIVENNIAEMNGNIPLGNSAGINTRFYGNIGLRGGVGMSSNRHPHYGLNNTGTVFMDNVSVGAQNLGLLAISVNDAQFINNTSIDAAAGFNGNNKYDKRYFNECPPDCWNITPNIKMINDLAVYKNGAGFGFSHTESFASLVLDHLNAFGSGTAYGPGTGGRTNSMSVDPKLGSCKVFIPEGSPMKGAGANGDDIGANVLCRYENGVLTDKQLWDWNTGQFPCGAMVKGVNDIPGKSCFDVNKRLNVNANGCTLPATPSCKQPAPPTGLPPPGSGDTGCAVCDPKQEIDVIINDTVCAPAGAAVPVSIEIVDALTGQPAALCRDVYVGPIPYGFTLSAGTVYENRTGGVIYKLTPAELLSLTVTPPAGYSGALALNISYTPPPR